MTVAIGKKSASPPISSTHSNRSTRSLPAIRLVRSSRYALFASRLLGLLVLLTVLGLLLLPWQQNIRGVGQVVEFSPFARPLDVQAIIDGRIDRWEPGIIENAHVEAGQPILHILDVDPDYELRLVENLRLAMEQVKQCESVVQTMEENVQSAYEYQKQMLSSADQLIESARLDVEAKTRYIEAATADSNYKKQIRDVDKQLFEKGGLTAGLEYQKAEGEYAVADAKLRVARNDFQSAQAKLTGEGFKKEAMKQDTEIKIQETKAKLRKEQTNLQAYQKEVLYSQRSLETYRQGKVVTAPRAGRVFKLHRNQGFDFVKKGDPLLTLVPETEQRAVELFIDGNDLPLLEEGNPVRLQFEGYPAVQFTPGWPEAAMGTFGGRVKIIDSTDDGMGRFRIVVLPDENDVPWPSGRFTRQGVRANGWVLLNRVTLGYELWRQLNGFPPIIKSAEPKDSKEKKSKPPLPK
jgi:membrane fusion protein, adhesin transport system